MNVVKHHLRLALAYKGGGEVAAAVLNIAKPSVCEK